MSAVDIERHDDGRITVGGRALDSLSPAETRALAADLVGMVIDLREAQHTTKGLVSHGFVRYVPGGRHRAGREQV